MRNAFDIGCNFISNLCFAREVACTCYGEQIYADVCCLVATYGVGCFKVICCENLFNGLYLLFAVIGESIAENNKSVVD